MSASRSTSGGAELASEEFAALGEGDVIFVEQSERLQRTAERPGQRPALPQLAAPGAQPAPRPPRPLGPAEPRPVSGRSRAAGVTGRSPALRKGERRGGGPAARPVEVGPGDGEHELGLVAHPPAGGG